MQSILPVLYCHNLQAIKEAWSLTERSAGRMRRWKGGVSIS